MCDNNGVFDGVLSAGWGSRNVGDGMHGFYVQR